MTTDDLTKGQRDARPRDPICSHPSHPPDPSLLFPPQKEIAIAVES